jgi:hypothetical protein
MYLVEIKVCAQKLLTNLGSIVNGIEEICVIHCLVLNGHL